MFLAVYKLRKISQKRVKRACILVTLCAAMSVFLSSVAVGETLNWWRCGVKSEVFHLDQMVVKEFERQNPGVSVKVIDFPWIKYRAKLMITLAGAKNIPDVMQVDTPWLPQFASREIISPVPEDVKEDLEQNYLPHASRQVQWEGTYYAYPMNDCVHIFFYNKDHFKEAGLDPSRGPRDWEEFRRYARILTKREGGRIVRAGYWINKRLMYLNDWLHNSGGSIINEDQYGDLQEPIKGTLDSEGSLKTWQLWYDLYAKDKVGSLEIPDRSRSFPAGIVSMCQTGTFLIRSIYSTSPDLNYGADFLPTESKDQAGMVQTGGWLFSVASASDKKELAWKLLKVMQSFEIEYDLITYDPVMQRKFLDDPRLEKMPPQMKKGQAIYETGLGFLRPKTTLWQEMVGELEPLVEMFLLGKLSVEEIAKQTTAKINQLIESTKEKGLPL